MAEKHVADAVLAADHRLFPEMQTDGTNLIPCPGPTIAQFPSQAIHPAFSWATDTCAKRLKTSFYSHTNLILYFELLPHA